MAGKLTGDLGFLGSVEGNVSMILAGDNRNWNTLRNTPLSVHEMEIRFSVRSLSSFSSAVLFQDCFATSPISSISKSQMKLDLHPWFQPKTVKSYKCQRHPLGHVQEWVNCTSFNRWSNVDAKLTKYVQKNIQLVRNLIWFGIHFDTANMANRPFLVKKIMPIISVICILIVTKDIEGV